MPLRTKFFSQFPWRGGTNTSLDPSVIPPNQLTLAKNLVFGPQGSRQKRDGINFAWDSLSADSTSVVAIADFWYGVAPKSHGRVAVRSDGKVYKYADDGTATQITDGGTAWNLPITRASLEIVNNLLIIAVDGTSNKMKKYTGSGSLADLGGTPPNATMMRIHQGRLFINDPTNPERLNYSPVGDPETWNGVGDSGAIDFGIGDGDPIGIAGFISFQGTLYVGKQQRLYQMTGTQPEDYDIALISRGLGFVSHDALATQDQDDVYYVSIKGVHSLIATIQAGELATNYVSYDIQKTFNENWIFARLPYARAAYVPPINSMAFAVTDSTVSSNTNQMVWLYNIPLKSWYHWPSVPCASMALITDSDKQRLYFGGINGKVAKAFNGTNYDINATGTHVAILMDIATGLIFPDQNPMVVKGFKKFSLLYTPHGTSTITCSVKIDNYSSQSFAFSAVQSSGILGVSFILGVSVLGYTYVTNPYTMPIDGYGRGCKVTMAQSGIEEQAEIQGFVIEYEPGSTSQETILSG